MDIQDDETFDAIKLALKGQTVIPVPRVSRETIISILGTHTELLKSLRLDHVALHENVKKVDKETKDNAKAIKVLSDDNEKNKMDIKSLFHLSNEFRKEMDELSEQVSELMLLKKQMHEQKEYVEKLTKKFERFNDEVGNFMTTTGNLITNLESGFNETQFLVKELKDYVDHFGDNIVLSSTQITVESQAGFSSKPLNLTEILKHCNSRLLDIDTKDNEQDNYITDMKRELDMRAPISLVDNMTAAESKISKIEIHLQKEEEMGIGAIRRTCDELTVAMHNLSTEVADKVDKESVGLIVHEKYEEIVRYLQDALQSSLEDENNFKQKADELQEMVIQLTNSKADRVELANMQEVLVKSEALLKKVGGQMNLKDRLKDFVSKKELEDSMGMKVDRFEFEQQIKQLSDAKRGKSRRSMGSFGMSIDEAIQQARQNSVQLTAGGSEINGTFSKSKDSVNGDLRPISTVMNVSQSMPVMAIGKAMNSPDRPDDFSNFAKGKKLHNRSNNLPNSTVAGNFRTATEGGKAGGSYIDDSSGAEDGPVRGKVKTPPNLDGYGRADYPFVPPKYPMDYQKQSTVTDHLAYLSGPVIGGGYNAKTHYIQHATPAALIPIQSEDVEGKGMMVRGVDGKLYYQDTQYTDEMPYTSSSPPNQRKSVLPAINSSIV